MGTKFTYEQVYNQFEGEGCELLETEYINAHTKMRYKCKCGNESIIKFYKFKQNQRCIKCSGTEKLTFEEVYKDFKDKGCVLLETEYVNNSTKMRYRCECGEESLISYNTFQQGHRCKECWLEKNRGTTHPNFNPNREEIPLNIRLRKTWTIDWVIKNMKDDPNYNSFIKDPESYVVDHIIPVSLFCKLHTKYILDEIKIKKIINQRDNLQLLTWKENSAKGTKGSSLFEAANYLINNGIHLIKFLEENERI